MEKFNRTLRGYDPEEVNHFLDQVISQVEDMVKDIRKKNELITSLEQQLSETMGLKEKIGQYERMETSLNHAIMVAQNATDQMKMVARKESETLVEVAKQNANRIVSEALLRAEKTENEALTLKRNINIFKRRIKDIIEAQLDVVEEMEQVEL